MFFPIMNGKKCILKICAMQAESDSFFTGWPCSQTVSGRGCHLINIFQNKKDISASGRRYLFLLQNHLKGKFIFLGEQTVKATRMHEENPFAVGKGLLF